MDKQFAVTEVEHLKERGKLFFQSLDGVHRVMIAGHTRPDGDCIGACMGLKLYIEDNYPNILVDVRLEEVPESYRVIPKTEDILTSYDDGQVYDLFIALDAGDKERLSQAVPYFEQAGYRICIDHHISNVGYADENLVCPKASSTCEMLAHMMDMSRISYDAALALYVGIICDTGVFKHSNTGKETMEVAGELMAKGIPFGDLIDDVFYRKTFVQNQLLGRCLLDAKRELDGQVVTCSVTQEVMQNFGACHADLEGVIDQLRVTKDVEVAVLASENETGVYKFSMRSNHVVDVQAIACKFGGGGHVRAAGFTGDHDGQKTLETVLRLIGEQL